MIVSFIGVSEFQLKLFFTFDYSVKTGPHCNNSSTSRKNNLVRTCYRWKQFQLRFKTPIDVTINYIFINDCYIYRGFEISAENLFLYLITVLKLDESVTIHKPSEETTPVVNLLPIKKILHLKIRNPNQWYNYSWIHKWLYHLSGFEISTWKMFFQIWLRYFEDMNEFLAKRNRSFSISICLVLLTLHFAPAISFASRFRSQNFSLPTFSLPVLLSSMSQPF